MCEADGTLNLQQKSVVRQIQQSATIMQRIAYNFLDLARLEAQTYTIQPALIDPIRDVINPVKNRYADQLGANGQYCEIRVSKPGLLIRADRALLTTVYDNLISNAIKFGQPGGSIILSINERGTEDELSVWNNGDGIDLDRAERMLELFTYNQDASPKVGIGVGLYLARRIIEAHGGRLWANSQPGAWACFTFTLPKWDATVRSGKR
jgi:signal transduction histidine kinase